MIALGLDKRGPPLRASAVASTAAQGDGRRDGDGGRGSRVLGGNFKTGHKRPPGRTPQTTPRPPRFRSPPLAHYAGRNNNSDMFTNPFTCRF